MLHMESSGSFSGTDSFLRRMMEGDIYASAQAQAEQGVLMLESATPKGQTGQTAASWSYEITEENGQYTIWFVNDHVNNGFNVAVGLQYGHATGQGGWVAGYDYINPALQPIFDKIAEGVWKEVQKA